MCHSLSFAMSMNKLKVAEHQLEKPSFAPEQLYMLDARIVFM